MNEDSTNEEGTGGMDRRSMLKRSAIVGGALVWTTPVVQSISGTAFGATPSETPPDPQEVCVSGSPNDRYYFRAVVNNGVVQSPFFTDIGNGGPQCMPQNYVAGLSTPASLLGQITITVTESGGGDTSFTVNLPAGFTIVEADVKVGAGNGNPDPDAPDGCFNIDLTSDEETANASLYEFTLPDTDLRTRGISNIYVVFSGCIPAPQNP